MNVTWIGSPNYWAGRTQRVTKLLQHWSVGDLAATDAQFQKNVGTDAATSAHYGLEGHERHVYVRDEDTAWHARQANSFAIGIEHSAGPGRPATDETYKNSIDLNAQLCLKFGLDPDTAIDYHKTYVATSCSELDLDRIKSGVKALLAAGGVVAPVLPPNKPSLPQPVANKNTGGSLHLPAAATSWRIYRESGPYTVGNQIGTLNPSLFGGLTYDILSNPTANVYVIQTRDFGRVGIYAGAETGASVAATNQGITMGSGSKKSVYLPAAPTWRVYRPGGPYTVGSEIGYLAPARYGGLVYAVLDQPASYIVTIQTQTFGRVAVYIGPGTNASIK